MEILGEKSEVINRTIERSRELRDAGFDRHVAHSTAWLEERIKQWPSAWGDNLQVLIYGDFRPLTEQLNVPALQITVRRVSA